MDLLLSFLTTHATQLERWRIAGRTFQEEGYLGSRAVPNIELGGAVAICSCQRRIDEIKITRWLDIPSPRGMVLFGRRLYIVISRQGERNQTREHRIRIISIDDFEQVGAISHRLINQARGLTKTANGFLLALAGIDTLLEVDENGNGLWDFWFTENGFDTTPLGTRRVLDKNQELNLVEFATLDQTTHVTGAYEIRDGQFIAATLFHQGVLITIDKRTKSISLALSNLHAPHHLRPIVTNFRPFPSARFTLANSGAGQILILNNDLSVERVIENPDEFRWIQDVVWTAWGTLVVADNIQRTLIEIDRSGRPLCKWPYPGDCQVFQILAV
jgi:hypothetical protein